MKRLLAYLATALLLVAPISDNAHALTPSQKPVVLGGVQAWSLPGSLADMFFARNGGSCAINRQNTACTSLLSTSRASPETCLWNDGHASYAANNMACVTDLGAAIWQASTNQALYARDMTNAAWVKVTMTTALTATGLDNAANSASLLTATADNATALQTLTITSQAETYSVYLERVTGSGNIQITENNGTTWTTANSAICTGPGGVASNLLTTAYVRCSVEATLANPIIGIRIVTNGDAVNVDFNQDEELAFATPPIPTTSSTVARAADVITLEGAALAAFMAPAGTVIASVAGLGIVPPPNNFEIWGDSSNRQFMLVSSGNDLGTFNGSVSIATTAETGWITGTKAAVAWDSTGRFVKTTNTSSASDTNAMNNGLTSTQYLGKAGIAAAQYLNGYLRRISVFPIRLSAGAIASLLQ